MTLLRDQSGQPTIFQLLKRIFTTSYFDDKIRRKLEIVVVNYAFIGVNIVVFLLLQQLGGNDGFVAGLALIKVFAIGRRI